MSGVFGPVAQIAVPDFAATQARAEEQRFRRQQMQQQEGLSQFFRDNAAGFAAADPNKRMNLLAMLAQQGGQGAAMALPQIQALREEMEWTGAGSGGAGGAPQGGQVASPAGGAPMAMPAGGGQGGDYMTRLVGMESGGNPNARNPRSSATGATQFIDGTWLEFARANPQRFQGMSREQVLAARNDPALSREAADWYRRENLTALSGQGLPANDGTAALAHRFGPQGAAALLRSPQDAPIAGVVGEQVMRANPDLNGRTVGQVVGNYAQRFGGGGDTISAQNRPGAAPGAEGIQRTPGGHILVPGYDPAMIDRAHALGQTNPRAQRFLDQYNRGLQSHLQVLQMTRRGEAEPMEVVEGPNGPVLMPRSQAAGMRPGSRETAPRSAERFQQDRELAEAGAARSNTTVNSGDRRTDVLIADAWKASEDTAVAAGRRAALFNRAEQAMQGFQPGVLAERRIWLGQVARELGIRSPATAEGEVLRQVQRQLELATVPQGQGAITENERGLIRDAIPVLLTTPEGARQAIGLIRRLDDYEMQIARIYRENARRNGGQPNAVSVREEIAAFIQQNQPPDVQAVLDNLSMPAAPASPAGVQAEPPPAPNVLRYNPRTGRIE